MIRSLSFFLLVPNFLFGFTVTKDTIYSPSLTTNPAYTSTQLKPSKNASTEILDSIKFSGKEQSSLGYLPKVQLEINGKIVDCLDSTPCENSMHTKIFTDTLNRLNGLIQFEVMADCIYCPTDIGNDCPCKAPSCQNAVLYTGQVLIFSGGSSLKITLIGTAFKCGEGYTNPFDPSAIFKGKKRASKARLPIHYELNGKKEPVPHKRDLHEFILIK